MPGTESKPNQVLWQHVVRVRLVPVTAGTAGLGVAGGVVMARTADPGWAVVIVTIAATLLMLHTLLVPKVMLVIGGPDVKAGSRGAADGSRRPHRGTGEMLLHP